MKINLFIRFDDNWVYHDCIDSNEVVENVKIVFEETRDGLDGKWLGLLENLRKPIIETFSMESVSTNTVILER